MHDASSNKFVLSINCPKIIIVFLTFFFSRLHSFVALSHIGIAIFLSDVFNNWASLLISAGVIFAVEIISQAVCAPHALTIGGYLWWIGVLLMLLLGIITFPFGKLLDFILGREMNISYNREQLKKLIQLQMAQDRSSLEDENMLDGSDVILLENTFDFSTKTAETAMTPIKEVFMLEV